MILPEKLSRFLKQLLVSKEVVLIGYSGHAYVVAEILTASGYIPAYYCEQEEKKSNPYSLKFLGVEKQCIPYLQKHLCFVAIGENRLRKKIGEFLAQNEISWIKAIHPSAIVSGSAKIGQGVMLGAGIIINAQASIGEGTICNTGSIIEHECSIGNFVHIAPAAVLCGGVEVGDNSFIGANAVIKQGIQIGKNVIVGAGSVVLTDLPDNTVAIGNPSKNISG